VVEPEGRGPRLSRSLPPRPADDGFNDPATEVARIAPHPAKTRHPPKIKYRVDPYRACDRPLRQNKEVPTRRYVSTFMTREDEDVAVEPSTQYAKQRIFRRLGQREPPPIWRPGLLRRLRRPLAGTLDLDAYRLTPARQGHLHVPRCGRKLNDSSVDERRYDGFGEQCPRPYVQPPNAPLDPVEMRSHRPIKCVAGKWHGLSLDRHVPSFARSAYSVSTTHSPRRFLKRARLVLSPVLSSALENRPFAGGFRVQYRPFRPVAAKRQRLG
jgi:hypothetical protein